MIDSETKDPSVEALSLFQRSPFAFIEETLSEIPQPPKPEFKEYVIGLYTTPAHKWNEYAKTIHKDMFEPFVKGKHLTWQQTILVIAIQRAVNGTLPPRIAVKAGRGTGKSSIVSRLILWYLFSYPLSKIPCTAPTADQLFSVLWSEISLILSKMKPEYRAIYEWETKFLRIKQHSQVWYARAKTSSPGETGSLSGIHADYMMSIADEAYDVEDQVFAVAEATQTGEKSLMLLIGNAVNDHGFFFDCFNKNAEDWVNITMNGEESPIVNKETIESIKKTYGKDSNHYRASVLGEFPIVTAIDIEGYSRLFTDGWLDEVMPQMQDDTFLELFDDKNFRRQRAFLGVDPAGEGSDEAVGYIRTGSAARLVYTKGSSDTRGIALAIIGTIENFGLDAGDVVVDNFGVGAELSQEVMIQSNSQYPISSINVGNLCEDDLDKHAYRNERARIYDMLYWWGKRGGKIMYDEVLREELKTIFSRKTENGKMEIMPKKEMRKRGYKSPNRVDALTLSFVRDYLMSNYVPRGEHRAVMNVTPKNKQGYHFSPQQKQMHTEFDRNNSIPSF